MGTNDLPISIHDSPATAPNYNLPEYKHATIRKAEVVRNGTVQGNDTVDLILVDDSGQKYVAMITGRLIQLLASTINVKAGDQHVKPN